MKKEETNHAICTTIKSYQAIKINKVEILAAICLNLKKKIMLIQKLDTKQCLFHLNKVLELEKLIYGKRNMEYWKSVNSEGGRHLENEGNFWNNTR